MTLINYLLLSEFAKYFALGLGILVLTSVVFTLFDLIPAIAKSGVGAGYAAAYLFYLAPQITYFVTPFALLLSVLTTYAVLSRSNQVTVLLASGQGGRALTAPILLATALVALALFYLSDTLLPRTNREQDARYHHIKGRRLEQATLAFGRKWVRGSQDTIYGYGYLGPDNRLLNAIAYELNPEDHLLRGVTYAATAAASPDGRTWEVREGWRYLITAGERSLRLAPEKVSRLTIPDGADLFKRTTNEASKMSYAELRGYIRQLITIGAPTTGLRVDLGKKISFPVSCLTLAALGLAFTFSKNLQGRRGALAGLGLSIIIGLIFWSATSLFEIAGRQAWLPVWMAVWGAQIIFLAGGTFLYFRRQI